MKLKKLTLLTGETLGISEKAIITEYLSHMGMSCIRIETCQNENADIKIQQTIYIPKDKILAFVYEEGVTK